MRRSRTALASEHGVVKNQRPRAATDTSSPATTPEHRRRRALLQLERLGYRVTLRTGGQLTGARPVIFASTRDNLRHAHLVGRTQDNPILTPFRRSSIENGTFAVPISTVNLPSLFSVTGAVNV